jgi:hypothetical protein
MTIEISNEEKISIIISHQRSLAYNEYGIQLSILQENAKANPNTSFLENLNIQLEDIVRQETLLAAELSALQA